MLYLLILVVCALPTGCRDEVNVNVAAASFCDGLTPLHLAAEGGALTEACLASLLQVKEVLTTVYTTYHHCSCQAVLRNGCFFGVIDS